MAGGHPPFPVFYSTAALPTPTPGDGTAGSDEESTHWPLGRTTTSQSHPNHSVNFGYRAENDDDNQDSGSDGDNAPQASGDNFYYNEAETPITGDFQGMHLGAGQMGEHAPLLSHDVSFQSNTFNRLSRLLPQRRRGQLRRLYQLAIAHGH